MGFLSNLASSKKAGHLADEKFGQVLKMVVDVLGHNIVTARDYEQRIMPALALATHYFDNQIAEIPGPVGMAGLSYGSDPFLGAVFPAPEEIQTCLGRSVDIKESLPRLAESGHGRATALLGMRCKDRDQSPGQATVFADHTLTCITPGEAATRGAIRNAACLRVLKTFDAHLDRLRQKGKLLAEEWNVKNLPLVREGAAGKGEFIYAEKELVPDNILSGLVAWLERPFDQFKVVESGLVIKGSMRDGQGAAHYSLPLMQSADRRHWISFLVEFSVDEGIRALGKEARSHRYIFI